MDNHKRAQEAIHYFIETGCYVPITETEVSIIFFPYEYRELSDDEVNEEALIYSKIDNNYYKAGSWAKGYMISQATKVMMDQKKVDDDDGVDYTGLDMD